MGCGFHGSTGSGSSSGHACTAFIRHSTWRVASSPCSSSPWLRRRGGLRGGCECLGKGARMGPGPLRRFKGPQQGPRPRPRLSPLRPLLFGRLGPFARWEDCVDTQEHVAPVLGDLHSSTQQEKQLVSWPPDDDLEGRKTPERPRCNRPALDLAACASNSEVVRSDTTRVKENNSKFRKLSEKNSSQHDGTTMTHPPFMPAMLHACSQWHTSAGTRLTATSIDVEAVLVQRDEAGLTPESACLGTP